MNFDIVNAQSYNILSNFANFDAKYANFRAERALIQTALKLMSRPLTEWVNAPTLIKSTPVSP